jgi:hypothetical protein
MTDNSAASPSVEVYLCQVNETLSCGACCGLYNINTLSRDTLEALLIRRTEEFASVARTEEGIDRFREREERNLSREKPFPEFHHCPFIGLIGEGQRRVGCLLHPAATGNNGQDFRWLSWYGAMACRIYFCPTSRMLPAAYQQIVREVVDDWYIYGLIITEHRLLAAFFKEIARRIGRSPDPNDFKTNPNASNIFRDLASLKTQWPYRRKHAPGPCNHVFDNGEYPRSEVFRESASIPFSRYEDILLELESGFSSPAEMISAEMQLDSLFSSLAAAITMAAD